MNERPLEGMRSQAEEIFRRSLEAVDPYKAVKRFVRVERDSLSLGIKDRPTDHFDLKRYDHVSLVGGGKATAPMARARSSPILIREEKNLVLHSGDRHDLCEGRPVEGTGDCIKRFTYFKS